MTSHRQTRRGFLRNVGLATGAGSLAASGSRSLRAQPLQTEVIPFNAKIYVQGVGNWMPHADGTKALVLFPDSDIANDELQLRTALHGGPLCPHHAVIQCDSQHLGLPIADAWTTLDVAGHWLRFEAEGAAPLVAGDLAGLPKLEAVLASVGKTFSPLPLLQSVQRARAGLVLHQGVVEPDADYLEEYTFTVGAKPVTGHFSNVHRLELGLVTGLSLRLRQFGTQEDRILDFSPPPSNDGKPGELVVWMRHFCKLDKPQSPPPPKVGPALDPDFTLNWTFQAQEIIADAAQLPFPLAPDSGGSTRRCMGAQTPSLTFPDPFQEIV